MDSKHTSLLKQTMQQHFSDAVADYDAHAHVQAEAARRLVARLRHLNPKRLLDIGAGTGFVTEQLVQRFGSCESIVATDISEAMLQHPRYTRLMHPIERVVMDAESGCAFATSSVMGFDVIVSNFAWQWFQNPLETLIHYSRHLRPGGEMLITTLGPNSFPVWRQALAEVGGDNWQPSTVAFDGTVLKSAFATNPPCQVILHRDTLFHAVDHGIGFWRDIKAIGAHARMAPSLPQAALRAALKKLNTPYQELYDVFSIHVMPREEDHA